MTLDKELREDEYFHAFEGPVLSSLSSLRAYLRMIPPKTYEHHVAAEKNDFATWVDHAFGETMLANKIRACKSREQIVWALDDAFSDARMAKVLANQEIVQKSEKAVPGQPESADVIALQDDALFDAQKNDIVKTNERISTKYEEVAKRMQEALLDPMPQEIEQKIERLKARYSDLQVRISEARKQRYDTLIPALMLRQFLPKLALARVTREDKDFKFAELVLDQAQFEFNELLMEKIIDVKKEVLALAGLDGNGKPAKAEGLK